MTASSRRRRRRARQRSKQASAVGTGTDELRQATKNLERAVRDLTWPQAHTTGQALPCRYTQLRQALYTHRGGNGGRSVHTIPAWIDALKYVSELDVAAASYLRQWPASYCHIADRGQHITIRRLNQLTTHHWAPTDEPAAIAQASQHLSSYANRIDDLFAAKPIYLPDPCPHCQHTTAVKLNDLGEHARTPALAVSADRGAWCQQCHDTWTPQFLGRLLGYPVASLLP